jgi:hypothetical protein
MFTSCIEEVNRQLDYLYKLMLKTQFKKGMNPEDKLVVSKTRLIANARINRLQAIKRRLEADQSYQVP